MRKDELPMLTTNDKAGTRAQYYRDAVLRTAGSLGNATMGALGLAGEAGEVADEIKKIEFHGKAYDRTKMLKELGDVRWYLEYLAATYSFTMEEIENANVEKLTARYPEGFTDHNTRLTRDEEHA